MIITFPLSLSPRLPWSPETSRGLWFWSAADGSIEHRRFSDLVDYLKAGDVLVFNDSRVIPARLKGKKADSGGKVELLLLRQLNHAVWEALIKPAKRVAIGTRLEIGDSGANVWAEITGEGEEGIKVIRFPEEMQLPKLGKIPLPPYIHTPLADDGALPDGLRPGSGQCRRAHGRAALYPPIAWAARTEGD